MPIVLPNMTDYAKVHAAVKRAFDEPELETFNFDFTLTEDGGTYTLECIGSTLELTADDLVEDDGDRLYFTPIKAFLISLVS